MKSKVIIVILLLICSHTLFSQSTTQAPGSFDFNKDGIIFSTGDSSTNVMMRFRMQNQMTFNSVSEDDLNIESSQLIVRRLRLRFGGNLYDPRLTFNLQLSFARGDLDFSNTNFPNIIRDAMIFYDFNENFQISFGQTKLPTNRQRVISSGDLQFSERSIVNSTFTLDRDFGVQSVYRNNIGEFYYNIRGAISQGDGRNIGLLKGGNYSYTLRSELLPFGQFTNGGDYYESDMAFEQTPKVSLGFTININDNTTRTGGQLGAQLYEPRSMTTFSADAVSKYDGNALYIEYAQRNSPDPLTQNSDGLFRYIYVGRGVLVQASHLWESMYEIGARYANVLPFDPIKKIEGVANTTNIGLIGTKYIKNHRAKIQLELIHNTIKGYNGTTFSKEKFWTVIANMELGI